MSDVAKPSDPPPSPPERRPPARYVWQRKWFQWVLGTIVLFLFLSFVVPPIYYLLAKVSGILTPVLIGLGLAYIFNPLVTWGERRHGLPRPVSAGLMLGAVGLVLLIAVAVLVPVAYSQGKQLSSSAPQYAETVLGWMGSDYDQTRAQVEESIKAFDWTALDYGAVRKALGIGAGAIFAGLGFLSYLGITVLVASFCFFVFVWKFDALKAWFVPFIPSPYRDETLRIMGMMDQTVSAIIRGRLIQSLCVMIVLSLGWWIVGVPYWLLLGVLGGLLNLLPYAAVLAWPVAVLLAMLGAADEGASIWLAAIGPSVVYFVAQSLDGWVVEPMVQGKATGMDALTVLLVVLIGGSLLGILGMILAIPVAACIKILSQELLLPKLRALAANPPDLLQKGS